MAIAGATRIFELIDVEPEVDDGYVTLVNVKKDGENLIETENNELDLEKVTKDSSDWGNYNNNVEELTNKNNSAE